VNPEETLAAGNALLAPLLTPAGFVLESSTSAHGSGGPFAVARWGRGRQFIELHFRWALGIVRYGWGDAVIEHRDLAAALRVKTVYPGFSSDPLDGFRHLAEDLHGNFAAILAPEQDTFRAVATNPPPRKRMLS
jgi:hypothetical protein